MATSKRNAVIGTVVDTLSTEVGWTEDFPIEGGLHIYNNQLKAHIGGEIVTVYPQSSSTTTTTTINISSAQILAMGTTPIELLPAPGANKYYDVEKVILEYTEGDTTYNLNGIDYLKINDSSNYGAIPIVAGMLNEGSSSYSILSGRNFLGQIDPEQAAYILVNSNVQITTTNGNNPTLGDGTLRAIITYTVRTFGA